MGGREGAQALHELGPFDVVTMDTGVSRGSRWTVFAAGQVVLVQKVPEPDDLRGRLSFIQRYRKRIV